MILNNKPNDEIELKKKNTNSVFLKLKIKMKVKLKLVLKEKFILIVFMSEQVTLNIGAQLFDWLW